MDLQEIKDKIKYDREHRTERIIERMKTMKPFDDEYIPEPPVIDKETYEQYVIPNFIRCGAIPKKDLIKGKRYYGNCRNASEAVWLGNKFEYMRYKFGETFPETIKHFEDEDYTGTDLFVPIREIK